MWILVLCTQFGAVAYASGNILLKPFVFRVLFQGSSHVTCPPGPARGAMSHTCAHRRSVGHRDICPLSACQDVMWGPTWQRGGRAGGSGLHRGPASQERREGAGCRQDHSTQRAALGPRPAGMGPGQPTKCAVEGQEGKAGVLTLPCTPPMKKLAHPREPCPDDCTAIPIHLPRMVLQIPGSETRPYVPCSPSPLTPMPEPALPTDEAEAQRASEEREPDSLWSRGTRRCPSALGSCHLPICPGKSLWPRPWEIGSLVQVERALEAGLGRAEEPGLCSATFAHRHIHAHICAHTQENAQSHMHTHTPRERTVTHACTHPRRTHTCTCRRAWLPNAAWAFPPFLAWSWRKLSPAGPLLPPHSRKLCGRQGGPAGSWTPDPGWRVSNTSPEAWLPGGSRWGQSARVRRGRPPACAHSEPQGLIYDRAPARVSKAPC